MNEELRKALEALTTAHGWAKADAEACAKIASRLMAPYYWRQEYLAAAIRTLTATLENTVPPVEKRQL